jgi:hypothetical protein
MRKNLKNPDQITDILIAEDSPAQAAQTLSDPDEVIERLRCCR